MNYLSGIELRKWPFRHGSFELYEKHDEIKRQGLISPGHERKGINTFSYDQYVERNHYVFIEPLRLTGGYGEDCFIMIDPSVIKQDNVRFLMRDFGEIITQIEIFLKDECFEFSEWIQEPNSLVNMIADEFMDTHNELLERGINCLVQWTHDIKIKFFSSNRFKRYAAKYYLSENQFFTQIEKKTLDLKYGLVDYLKRDRIKWPFSEEILIPKQIEPEFLLGYYDGDQWQEWNSSSSDETNNRIKLFFDELRKT